MKRKIHFVITVAKSFTKDSLYKNLDVPIGKDIQYTDLLIEFEQTKSGDPMPDAYDALRKWVNKNHPNMDYRIYYWTLEFV